MLKNYLTTALRTLRRRKGYAFLNVAGLAVGLACVLLIGLWVQDELSYDDFHPKSERTYRVLREFDIPDLKGTIDGTPAPLAAALEAEVPAVEQAVRLYENPSIMTRGARTFSEPGLIWADEGFFEMFSFEMKRGEAALGRPKTVVITEAMAQKYFPGEHPVGRTIQEDDTELEVTGVMENVPANSHFDFTFVASAATLDLPENWGWNGMTTYLTLAEGTAREEALPQVDEVVLANTGKKERPDSTGAFRSFIPHLQPLEGIHFGQGITEAEIGSGQVPAGGSMGYVWLFGALAGFVLLLACINFTNLATARSTERAGEVGMRKALGAQREQLAGQFLGEALLLSGTATLLAVLLARAGLPLLNALSGKELALGPMLRSAWVLALPALALVVGLVAGAWPAFALSRFEPAEVLRGTFTRGKGGRRFRQGLVVFQFVVSIGLIAATAVVYQQLDFMQSKGLGFDEENVVVIEQADALEGGRRTFEQELRQLPGVERVASAYSVPGRRFTNSMWRPATPGAERQNLNYSWADFGFFETMQIPMKAGRSFERERASDSLGIVLNEAALADYGWTAQEAVGKKIERGFEGAETEYTVIGVVEDFHYESLHEEIYPMAYFGPTRAPRFVTVRLAGAGEDAAATLAKIGAAWEQFSDLPLDYSFLADDLAAQYEAEARMAKVFGAGALLAVLVACLGLFGLAAFTAERRTKEIAVRKALGASVPGIVGLLSKDFLKLVAIGFLIAAPLAWVGMRHWLDGFAYRIDLGPLVFVAAGLLALAVAMATVSYQALKAARLAPADALRDE